MRSLVPAVFVWLCAIAFVPISGFATDNELPSPTNNPDASATSKSGSPALLPPPDQCSTETPLARPTPTMLGQDQLRNQVELQQRQLQTLEKIDAIIGRGIKRI